MFKIIIGCLFIITGILDALKYSIEAKKIRFVETAKGHSRKFINMAMVYAIVRMIYAIYVWDIYLSIISILSLVTLIDLYFTIYWFYPYRYRNLLNFKKPSLLKYIINSIKPNHLRKRL